MIPPVSIRIHLEIDDFCNKILIPTGARSA
jgi:hypothetical protein